MFNGTIFQNVAYGLSSTPDAQAAEDVKFKRVEQACRAAYAHEFVEQLPDVAYPPILNDGAFPSLY
jgi:ATP-binding cassette, subfamily B (MDR/TAP), member 1